MTTPQLKHIPLDLSYIYEISDHDRDFIKEMLLTFLKITPESLDQIETAKNADNWKEVGRVAHKIKPTIMLIGNDVLTKQIKKLEQDAKHERNLDNIPMLISEINTLGRRIVAEITDLIKTDRF